jgi:hypothetical protein
MSGVGSIGSVGWCIVSLSYITSEAPSIRVIITPLEEVTMYSIK